jgi:glutamate-1-semialdehyde 2,1-aminomutase
MLQYYLREAGLALSWVGTGRFIFSLNYTDADMAEVTRRLVAACQRMQADGWWWQSGHTTHKDIKRKIMKEMLLQRLSGKA